ncbi:MAG: hypothetical protein H0W50_02375 [Parachlamydiaceae bacterium]|nr:hypothetical protein [Parachlamydiaceae bacterium]
MEHFKTHSEGMRQLLELAICCGRGWQSPQTGYIHYFYSQQDESYHHPIPTYENMLFILALFRSRIVENINEGKDLLKKLLRFQSIEKGMEGNFPVYLHDYPLCKDSLCGAQIVVPLYWIYKNFNHILGTELKDAVKNSLISLQTYCLSRIQEKSAPFPIAMKIAAGALSVGQMFENETFLKKGEILFNDLVNQSDQTAWNSPIALSELIIAFQMLSPSLSENPQLKGFWNHLLATWHPDIGAYCGPGWKEYEWRKEPQVTFYDYFMGYLSSSYSQRCFADHPIQLQAALVHPSDDRIPSIESKTIAKPEEYEGMIRGLPWKFVKHPNLVFSLLAKDNSIFEVQEKAFIPLKILWNTSQRLRSFVCQGGCFEKIDFKITKSGKENEIEMYFYFKEVEEGGVNERMENDDEIGFYLDYHEDTKIAVEKMPANTFKLDEEITFEDENVTIALCFSLHEGDGSFLGHLIKGNRPCQRATTGANRFAAYDWHVFLRTIQRSEVCTIKATLRMV